MAGRQTGREDAGVSIMSGGNDKEPRYGLVWCGLRAGRTEGKLEWR